MLLLSSARASIRTKSIAFTLTQQKDPIRIANPVVFGVQTGPELGQMLIAFIPNLERNWINIGQCYRLIITEDNLDQNWSISTHSFCVAEPQELYFIGLGLSPPQEPVLTTLWSCQDSTLMESQERQLHIYMKNN